MLSCHQAVKRNGHDRGMNASHNDRILVENFEPESAPMRIAVVTETWPPEVNGVALTLSKLVQLLSQRSHTIQLIRPRQDKSDASSDQFGWSEMLIKGLPIPHYPHLKLGLPSKKHLSVHGVKKGPIWSTLPQKAHWDGQHCKQLGSCVCLSPPTFEPTLPVTANTMALVG